MTGLEGHFHELCELDPGAREKRLAELAAADPGLASRLRSLLAADAELAEIEAAVGAVADPPAAEGENASAQRQHPAELEGSFGGGVPAQGAYAETPTDLSRWLLGGEAGAVPESDLAGRRVGNYTIERVVGSGGMGVVCAARQESTGRLVALKLLHHGISSAAARERFTFEARVLSRLRHEGIAQVFEAGSDTTSGLPVPWISLELIEDARDLLGYARESELDVPDRVRLFCRVLDAVDHGHRRGIIHRDLKPSNILVDSRGRPKVIDFGIARALDDGIAGTRPHTMTGAHLGTPEYMSPEQALGSATGIDTRSDVYSLGVVLYRLLCGQSPYKSTGSVTYEMMLDIATRPPVPLAARARELRGDLSTIVGKSLEKDPEARYATAGELARDLRRWLGHEPIEARRPGALRRAALWTRRRRGAAAALAVVLMVMLVAAGLLVESNRKERRSADESRLLATRESLAANRARLSSAMSALARHDAAAAKRHLASIDDEAERGPLEWGTRLARNELGMAIAVHHEELVEDRGPTGTFAWIQGAEGPDLVIWQHGAIPGPCVVEQTGRLKPLWPMGVPGLTAGSSPDTLVASPNGAIVVSIHDPPTNRWNTWGSAPGRASNGPVRLDPREVHDALRHFVIDPRGRWIIGSAQESYWRGLIGEEESLALRRVGTFSAAETYRLSDGGDLFFIGGSDFSLHICEVGPDGELALLRSVPAHDYKTRAIAIDSRRSLVATGSNDGSLHLWSLEELRDAEQPEPLCRATGHAGGIAALDFHPTLPLLVSGGYDQTLRWWRIVEPRDRSSPRGWSVVSEGTLHGHLAPLAAVEFSRDGSRLASNDIVGRVIEWPALPTTPRMVLDHRNSSVTGVGWMETSREELIFTSGSGELRFWDSRSGELRGTIRRDLRITDTPARVPGKPWFATRTPLGTVEVFEAALAGEERGDEIEDRLLATSGEPRWSPSGLPDPHVDAEYGHSPLTDSAWPAPDLLRVAVTKAHGAIEIHEFRSMDGRLSPAGRRSLGPVLGHPDFELTRSLALAADGTIVVACHALKAETGSWIEVWDLARGAMIRTIELDAPSYPGAFAGSIAADPRPGSRRVAIGFGDGEVGLIEDIADPLSPLRKLGENAPHEMYVAALAFLPGERDLLFSGGGDHRILAWDLSGEGTDPVFELEGHFSSIAALAFDAPAERLVSGGGGNDGEENVARVWESVAADSITPELRQERARVGYLLREAQRKSRRSVTRPGLLDEQLEQVRGDPALVAGIDDPAWQASLQEMAVTIRKSRGAFPDLATERLLEMLLDATDQAEIEAIRESARELLLEWDAPWYALPAYLGALVRLGDLPRALALEAELGERIRGFSTLAAEHAFLVEIHLYRALLHWERADRDETAARAAVGEAERLIEEAKAAQPARVRRLLDEVEARLGG